MTEHEADAAALRRAFNHAAETFPGSVTQFLENRGKSGVEQMNHLMAWWKVFYEAIRDTTAGLKLLGRIAKLEADSQRLFATTAHVKMGRTVDEVCDKVIRAVDELERVKDERDELREALSKEQPT